MKQSPRRFYWRATASSGGTLSLDVGVQELRSKSERIGALADALKDATKFMEERGYIPFQARLMSSRDIAAEYGKTRQYWEKLLNEGKILYKETSAGRITTDLWVEGYLGNKAEVDKYVKDVKTVLQRINEARRRSGSVVCPVCEKERFEFYVNTTSSTNGLCRSCGFHVHTSQ